MFGLDFSFWETPRYYDGGVPSPKLVHYTIVFNVFMFMQIFNMFNARKLLKTDLNIFANFFNNWAFIFILIGIILAQVAMTMIGGPLFQTTALTGVQWIVCVSIGFSSWIAGVVLKVSPDTWVEKIPFRINEDAPKNDLLGKLGPGKVQGDSFRLDSS